MIKSIVNYLKEVPDPREAQGSRDDLWQILLIIIMGIMSGLDIPRAEATRILGLTIACRTCPSMVLLSDT
jgi:hypothetical protein